jgi:pyruvate dehydrogenase E2 component (dihydrolipoamide acetyltransferase)
MPTDIVMPQMGESIFEGTITKWLKKPGDKVQRDEPLFEISTDKVDAEIPAPASGVLQDIKVAEGATVQVNTVVGTISADGESAASKTASPPSQARKESTPAKAAPAPEPKADAPSAPIQPVHAQASHEEEDHARSSPLVRKIAREHNISLAQVPGTGLGGRITKQDITVFLEKSQPGAAAATAPAAPQAKADVPHSHRSPAQQE